MSKSSHYEMTVSLYISISTDGLRQLVRRFASCSDQLELSLEGLETVHGDRIAS